MPKVLALLISCCCWGTALAQFAIVKDKDGFVNVRSEASTGSKVSDTIASGRIVYCFEPEKDWVMIDYPKKGYDQSGYVHRSRLFFIDSLPSFRVVQQNDSALRLAWGTMQISMASQTFSLKGRKFKYEKAENGKFLVAIDNKTPWGTDGNMPRFGYRYITINDGNSRLSIPAAYQSDLFEPNMHMTNAYFDKATQRIYLSALNSDGAGGYAVLWIIEKGKLIHREVRVPF